MSGKCVKCAKCKTLFEPQPARRVVCADTAASKKAKLKRFAGAWLLLMKNVSKKFSLAWNRVIRVIGVITKMTKHVITLITLMTLKPLNTKILALVFLMTLGSLGSLGSLGPRGD